MNLVFVMSVVVLSLVYFFVRFGGTVRVYAQRVVRKKKRRRDVMISLSLSLSVFSWEEE